MYFFFSSRRRHTRYWRDWSSDVCSSDLTSFQRDTVHRRILLLSFQVYRRGSHVALATAKRASSNKRRNTLWKSSRSCTVVASEFRETTPEPGPILLRWRLPHEMAAVPRRA